MSVGPTWDTATAAERGEGDAGDEHSEAHPALPMPHDEAVKHWQAVARLERLACGTCVDCDTRIAEFPCGRCRDCWLDLQSPLDDSAPVALTTAEAAALAGYVPRADLVAALTLLAGFTKEYAKPAVLIELRRLREVAGL